MNDEGQKPWNTELQTGWDGLLAQRAGEGRQVFCLDEKGETFTYQDMDRRANKVANLLQMLGAKEGDRMAVMMPNGPPLLAALFGVFRLNALALLLNPELSRQEAEKKLRTANVKIVFTDQRLAGRHDNLRRKIPSVKEVVVFSAQKAARETRVDLLDGEKLLARASGHLQTRDRVPVGKDDAALLVVRTKEGGAAMETITHGQLYQVCRDYAVAHDFKRGITILNAAHPAHLVGQMMGIFIPLLTGGKVITCEGISLPDFQKVVRRRGVDWVVFPSEDFSRWLESRKKDKEDLGRRLEGFIVTDHRDGRERSRFPNLRKELEANIIEMRDRSLEERLLPS